MPKIHKVQELPEETLIANNMSKIDYFDSYKVITNTNDSIQEIVKKALTFPGWITFALKVRYYLLVKPFGLSSGTRDDITGKSEIVPIIEENENEVVMGQNDKHLYYRISFMKKAVTQGTEIYLNTVVRFNNIWGKIYFIPVKIGHKLVVKSVLQRLAN